VIRFLALMLAVAAVPAAAGAQTRLVGDLPRKESKPLETTAGLETEYGHVRTAAGYRLRTILTRPTSTTRRLPAVFVTQAVSCGTMEFPPDVPTSLRQIALRSGYAVIRVERAGTGDSEGPACSALDYDTEVQDYRQAFDALSRHPWIDGQRVVIYGSSLGSTTAPLVAQGKRIVGIFVQGGGALTYLERMINFDRLYFERSGKFKPEEVHERVLRSVRFNQEYLIGRKTPEQIVRDNPDLAGVWESMRGTAEAPPHYGRPHAWHWQAAQKDFLAAWSRIDAPVLVIHGEYEQFEPRHSHEMIVDLVNELRPGTATFIQIPKADHSLRVFPSARAAYREEGGETNRALFVEPVLEWLKAIAAR
jgi:pimeloyl-ACP methyl ester carboxylesterase